MANIYNEPESTNVKITLKNNVYSYLNTEIGKAKICLITDQRKFGYSDLYGNLKKCLTDASGSSVTPENCVFIADSEGSASHSTTFVYNDNKLGVNIAAPQSKAHFHEPTTASCLIQITNSTTGSSDEYDGMTIGFSGGDNVIRTTYMRPVKIQSEDTLTPGTFRDIATFIDDGGPNREVILDADGYIKSKLMVGSLTETPEALLTVYGENDEPSIALVSDSVGPVLTLGIDAISSYTDVPVIRATGYNKIHLFIQRETETPGIYDTWMEFSNKRIIIPKTLEIGEKYDISPDAKIIAWSNNVDTLAIKSDPLSSNGLYMGITTVDSQPGCPVIRAKEYNGAHLHIQNTDGDTYIEFETIEDVKTVTLGGNLALGANTISRDGEADKGIGVGTTGIPTVTATAALSGEARTVLRLYDDTDFTEGDGAGIGLYAKFNSAGTYTNFGGIKVSKENGVDGDYSSSFYIQTRKQGSQPANALRLDSDQNGYITNKLMVGSLTETPTVKLAVYNDGGEGCLMSISDYISGPNSGLVLGIAETVQGPVTLRTNQCIIRADGYSRNLYFQGETTTPNVFSNYIACEFDSAYDDVKTVTVADKLVVDGNLQVGNDITLLGNFDADDKITASAISAKYLGSATHRLDIKSSYSNIARFSSYDVLNTLTVYGEIQCDTFNILQDPTAGSITPDKYITIKCNGTNYKIPVVAA